MTPEQLSAIDSVISQDAMDALPFPAHVFRTDGLVLRVNRANEEFWGVPPAAVVGLFNMLEHPGDDPAPPVAFKKAAGGRAQTLAPVLIDIERLGLGHLSKKKAWIENSFFPIKDASGTVRYVLLLQRDVTTLVEKQEEIQRAYLEIASQREIIESLEQAKRELAVQRETILALSSPIIEIWKGVLALPVVGHVDAARAADMTERLLRVVVESRARHVVLDLTGINDIDEVTANHFLRILRAIELLGARGIVAGVQPAVARAIVSLGLELDAIRTHRNLRDALTYCMREAEADRLQQAR
jgi:anti-anti-sigma regulatory factor